MTLEPLPPPSASSPYRLRQSSLATFQQCPRKFKHAHIDRVEPREQRSDEALEFGQRFAKVLELNAANETHHWAVGPALTGLSGDFAATLVGTSAAYASHWRGSLSYLGTEVKLTTPIPGVDRIALTTTLDGLAHDERGDLVVVDQKTTSSDISPGSWFWEKLQISLQPSTYIWAAREHGYDVKHAVWDAVKRWTNPRRTESIEPEYYQRNGKGFEKGQLKPGTGIPAESVAEYAARVKETMLADTGKFFQRAPVVRLQSEIDACLDDVRQETQRILHAWDNDAFPRNTSSCWAFKRKCEYFEVCCGNAQINDPQLFQIRKEA